MKLHSIRSIALATFVFAAVSANAQIIFSNNPDPGDFFTSPSTSGATQAIGATGWFYNNVRNNAVVGINTNNPRSGNGSVYFSGTQTGAFSHKADIEYFQFASPGNPTSGLAAMGTLGALNSLSYDWYRDSSSTADSHLHPSLRLYIDADGNMGTTTDRGYLIFEGIYNGQAAAPTDAWQTSDIFNWNGAGQSANMWLRQFSPGQTNEVYDRSIQDWIAGQSTAGFLQLSGQSAIYGLSAGIGSGWGPFEGAVDNISIGFTGGTFNTYNFEAAPVPEPGTMAVLGLGALAMIRKRRKSS